MYTIIVGAGEVGTYLARILVEEGHDVAVIESNDRVAREMDAALDALVVHGSGVSHRALLRAGVSRADLILAVTAVDEVNLMACMTAVKFGQNLRAVARVRQIEYLRGEASLTAKEMGISLLVGPEHAVATRVVNLLSYEGSGEIRYLADRRIALLELPLSTDSPFVHDTLSELKSDLPQPSLVAAVIGPDGLYIPTGDDVLRVDERAYVLTKPENVGEFTILSGKPWFYVRHVLIIGCGTIGFDLAQELESQGRYPTILELDPDRADWVARHLTKSLVLCGSGTDPQLLREQLEEVAHAVVVLLEDDEQAVLVGLFAKSLGARKVIVRSDKLEYAPIAHKLGIDALISPRRALADAILRFVRRGPVSSAHMLGDHDGEIIEMTVPDPPENRELIEKPLKDLELPQGALIGAIIHEDEITIASGDTVLSPGDNVLVVARPSALREVERFLD